MFASTPTIATATSLPARRFWSVPDRPRTRPLQLQQKKGRGSVEGVRGILTNSIEGFRAKATNFRHLFDFASDCFSKWLRFFFASWDFDDFTSARRSGARATGKRDVNLPAFVVGQCPRLAARTRISAYLETPEFMRDLPYHKVSYCMYGFDYKKNTRIWTNNAAFQPKLCTKGSCGKRIGRRHAVSWTQSVHSTEP